ETLTLTRERVPPPLSPALARSIFAAEPGDPLIGRARAGDAVLLAELTEVAPLEEDALAEAASAVETALVASLEQDQLEYYGRAVQDLHGAELNPGAIERVTTQLAQSGR